MESGCSVGWSINLAKWVKIAISVPDFSVSFPAYSPSPGFSSLPFLFTLNIFFFGLLTFLSTGPEAPLAEAEKDEEEEDLEREIELESAAANRAPLPIADDTPGEVTRGREIPIRNVFRFFFVFNTANCL